MPVVDVRRDVRAVDRTEGCLERNTAGVWHAALHGMTPGQSPTAASWAPRSSVAASNGGREWLLSGSPGAATLDATLEASASSAPSTTRLPEEQGSACGWVPASTERPKYVIRPHAATGVRLDRPSAIRRFKLTFRARRSNLRIRHVGRRIGKTNKQDGPTHGCFDAAAGGDPFARGENVDGGQVLLRNAVASW